MGSTYKILEGKRKKKHVGGKKKKKKKTFINTRRKFGVMKLKDPDTKQAF